MIAGRKGLATLDMVKANAGMGLFVIGPTEKQLGS